jgi:hypothetical protein
MYLVACGARFLDLSWYCIPKRGKCTKRPQHMYTKWPYNVHTKWTPKFDYIFHSKAFQTISELWFLVNMKMFHLATLMRRRYRKTTPPFLFSKLCHITKVCMYVVCMYWKVNRTSCLKAIIDWMERINNSSVVNKQTNAFDRTPAKTFCPTTPSAVAEWCCKRPGVQCYDNHFLWFSPISKANKLFFFSWKVTSGHAIQWVGWPDSNPRSLLSGQPLWQLKTIRHDCNMNAG